jgi:DNA (cytosine-5)-methyltransferase 1
VNVAVRSSINVISLCTGGGGLDLGVQLAIPGARGVVYVEREAFAVAHLVSAMQAGFMDEAPVWSDVSTFNGRPWRGLVDGVIGGIPCQPHSIAGNRLAEEDERDLWSPARRIVVQARPGFVFIENVDGFVSSGGLFRVWRDLRRLGYEVEVGFFSASEVGASHRRGRCFVLAVADASGARLEGYEQREAHDQWEREASPGSTAELHRARMVFEGIERQYPAPPSLFAPGPAERAEWDRIISTAPHLEPAVRRVVDGMAVALDVGRVDRLRMLGNGVVPLEAAYALRTLATRLAQRAAGAAQLVRVMS